MSRQREIPQPVFFTRSAADVVDHQRQAVFVFPAKSAIRWFKQHAGELGVDPARIITGGGSAGGHISALATLNPGLNDPADPAGIDTGGSRRLGFF